MGMIGNSLAQGLISGANIQDGTVDTPDIKDSAVTAAKIASGVVTPAKMDFTGGTANGLLYLNGSKVASSGSDLVFDGTNVGIGTNSPVTRLDVSGGASTLRANAVFNTSSTAGTGSAAYIRSNNGYSSATTPDYSWWYDDQCGLFHPTGSVIGFTIAGTEAMRIDSSGNLLVGTTGYIGGAGTAGLTSKTIASGHFAAAFEGYYGVGINAIPATGALMYFYYNGGGSPVGSIYTNGSSTSYGTSSDYRLKENVAPMSGALAKVAALKPCTYTWKATGESDEGFIAHELQEVCPSAVSGKKDAVNEDGSIKPQGIDTSFLVATLTAAIQEQQAIITQLQADVAALKGN
jgi:hypothetical protein